MHTRHVGRSHPKYLPRSPFDPFKRNYPKLTLPETVYSVHYLLDATHSAETKSYVA